MPFPLAHPAAVLPLRRWCPLWLSFPALVIGSLAPDAGYVLVGTPLGTFAHSLLGSVAFCLPVGLAGVVLLGVLRRPLVALLPEPQRQALSPWSERPIGCWWVVLLSLLVGTWTHLFWDSFTHNEGWFVQHLAALQAPVTVFHGHTARVCHFLWYGCSFGGILCVFVAFERWKRKVLPAHSGTTGQEMLRDGLLLALLVFPIELIHHLIRGPLGMVLVAVFTGLLAAGVAWRAGKHRARALPTVAGKEVPLATQRRA